MLEGERIVVKKILIMTHLLVFIIMLLSGCFFNDRNDCACDEPVREQPQEIEDNLL